MIAQLNYNAYPPGQEWRKGQEYPPTVTFDRARIWATYKQQHPPPGLMPHPWADLGETFKHAFVTPIGFTILDTVGVAREIAIAAAWRWYDIRLALAAAGKLKADIGTWPSILDLTDSDIERHMQHAVLMTIVAAADRRDGIV